MTNQELKSAIENILNQYQFGTPGFSLLEVRSKLLKINPHEIGSMDHEGWEEWIESMWFNLQNDYENHKYYLSLDSSGSILQNCTPDEDEIED